MNGREEKLAKLKEQMIKAKKTLGDRQAEIIVAGKGLEQ